MILRTITLTIGSSRPGPNPAEELRELFAAQFNEYARLHRQDAAAFIHRYPVVQYRMIGTVPTVTGINEGAEFLRHISRENPEIRMGENTYHFVERDALIREEEFGISDRAHFYEFVTPWLALSQEQYRKFYTLKGKPARDAFVKKILTGALQSMASSLNDTVPRPITCEPNLHFQKDRFDGAGIMVFTGKFQADFMIPDLLGIGKSVSRGFGAVRQLKPKDG